FRGSEPRAVPDRFENLPVVALRTSRRAGSALLAASRRVALRLPGRAEHRALVPAAGAPPGRVDVRLLRSSAEEASYIAGVLRAPGDGGRARALLARRGAAVRPGRVRPPVQRVAGVLAAGREARDAGASAEDVLWAVWNATGLAYTWEAASLAGGPAGAAADR